MLTFRSVSACLALCACSGSGATSSRFDHFDAAATGDGLDVIPAPDDAGREPMRRPDAAAPEPAPPRPPVPLVPLAPALETGLGCDNVELPFDFDPTPRGFDVNQAFWMMWFAERSFFSEHPDTEAELARIGFDRYAHYEDASTGLSLYAAGSDDTIVVAIRGSEELNDWLADFNFPQDEGALHGVAGRVHRGFASALTPTFSKLANTIAAFSDAGQTVWITGHSLGGAEATLAAARLARAGSRMGPLYTFAAPRAGDGAFAMDAFEALERRAYRIVNERDLVPHVPPAAVAADEAAQVLPLFSGSAADLVRDLDYRHVGQMAWLEHPLGDELTMLPVMSDADDEPYWAEAAKGGAFGAISSNQKQGERHAQQRYLCRLLALRTASMSSQPPSDAQHAAEERRIAVGN